jgi:hypothetical protein
MNRISILSILLAMVNILLLEAAIALFVYGTLTVAEKYLILASTMALPP